MASVLDRENKWLTIQETAEMLGVNPRTVRRYIRLGRLDVSRISNKVVRIRLADIDRFMETNVVTPKTAEPEPEPQPKPVGKSGRRQPVRPARPARFSSSQPGTFG